MDHVFPSCVHCGNDDVALDVPKGHRPMCKYCIYAIELVPKGRSKVNNDISIKTGVANVQVTRKLQSTLDFKSCSKDLKIEEPHDEALFKEAVKLNAESSSPSNKDNNKELLKEAVMLKVESSSPSNKDNKKKILKEAVKLKMQSSLSSNKDNKKELLKEVVTFKVESSISLNKDNKK